MQNVISIEFNKFVEFARFLPRDVSILVLGDHGVGKSAAVKLMAQLDNEPCYDIRLAGKEPGDIIGALALSEDGKTSLHRPPEWWRPFFDPDCKATLFLDELNRAHRDVRQGIFQLVLDRELNGYKLPKNVRIVVAGNDGEEYDVDEMDSAFITRFAVVRLEPSVDEWLALDNIHSFVRRYISRHRNVLDSAQKTSFGPCRRGWSRLSHILTSNNIKDPQHPLLFTYAASCIGAEVGVSFAEFCKKLRTVSGKEILLRYDEVKQLVDLTDVSLISKLNEEVVQEVVKVFVNNKKKKKTDTSTFDEKKALTNLAQYMIDQPIETFYALFNELSKNGCVSIASSIVTDLDETTRTEFRARLLRAVGYKIGCKKDKDS